MATFKPVVFKSKNHIKIDGTTNIKIRIYHNKEAQYIATDYFIQPGFMGNDGMINSFHPDAELFNYELSDIVQKLRKASLKLGSVRTSNMSCSEFKEFIEQIIKPEYDTIDFIAFSKNMINETEKEKTAEWYQQSLNSFMWFSVKAKIDARDITRRKIGEWIEQLRKSGQTGKPLSNGAISNYVRGLRALYNACKKKYNDPDHDIIRIPNDPFVIEDIPVYKRKRRNISIDMIKRIRDYETDLKRVALSRDVFMIMFYMMGINIGDLYRIKKPIAGRLNYERSKTDRDDNLNNFMLSIKIEPELRALIERYSVEGFLHTLKKYSNEKNFTKAINKGLAQICEDLNFPKITTNWARHSWASIARNKAYIAKADVDFCLGHSSPELKMADIYIDIDYGICDRSNRKVLDLLK